MRCPKCGSEETGKFCSNCGAKVAEKGPRCRKCSSALEPDAVFCSECGTPTGFKPEKPKTATLPWVFSALALVAFAVAIAFFVRGQAAPRIGDMGMTGGLPEAEQGQAMGGAAGAPSGGMADLSQMSPRQAADRLFERAMREEDGGDTERAKFFANMAVQAYGQVPPAEIDLDAHFHLGLLQLLQENTQVARAEAETILAVRPNHLLGLALSARVARAEGDDAAEAAAYDRFLESLDSERASGLTEYQMHGTLIDNETVRAREVTGTG
jgi:predicted nucleic acid-binding Zn ribbon protein